MSITRHKRRWQCRILSMFHGYDATVTVGADGRVEFIIPEATPGSRVHVFVREESDEEWVKRLSAGTLHGPSLKTEHLTREAIYAEDSN